MLKFKVRLSRPTDLNVKLSFVSLILVEWLISFPGVSSVTVSSELQKELTLTQQEKTTLDRFKSDVYQIMPMEFMKQDLFLLRWIRAKDLDLIRAERDMLRFLQFIEENNLTKILEEDFGDLWVDYPFYWNITDRQGRPVGYGSIGGGNWNIRRGMIQGKRGRLMRYVYYMVLGLNQMVIEAGKTQPNVTQFVVLMDLGEFNPMQHTCPMCVSTYINLLDSYERFFPGYLHEIIVINAPQAYLGLVDALRPFLSKGTRQALKVFGPNRSKWMPYLDSKIDTNKIKEFLKP